jgi:cysteine desulfurase
VKPATPVYLDYNATTPVDPQVLEAMLPYFSERFGNAASRTHAFGWIADEAVEIAREQAASLIGASKHEIIFTSGATESINLALKGMMEYHGKNKNHLITCKAEHKAVLDTCTWLEQNGYSVTYLDVNPEGLIDLHQLTDAIKENTLMVCLMFANNETGVIQPIEEVGRICHEKGVYFFTDATQAAGKVRLDVIDQNIDLMCISAHKMYGPKGAGLLYVRKRNPRVSLKPILHGGGHEKGLRSGTLNVPAIVGFGKACELASLQWFDESRRVSLLRSYFEQELTKNGNAFINGSIKSRLPNTSNLRFVKINSSEFIKTFPEIAVATGSACTSAENKPSHVLSAMGLSEKELQSSIRFSFGRFTNEEEIEFVLKLIKERTGIN